MLELQEEQEAFPLKRHVLHELYILNSFLIKNARQATMQGAGPNGDRRNLSVVQFKHSKIEAPEHLKQDSLHCAQGQIVS